MQDGNAPNYMTIPDMIIIGLRHERQREKDRQVKRDEQAYYVAYTRAWRQRNREQYNQYMRVYRFQRRLETSTTVVDEK